jgi:hypothetical protein
VAGRAPLYDYTKDEETGNFSRAVYSCIHDCLKSHNHIQWLTTVTRR